MTGDEKETRFGNIRKSVMGSNIHIDSEYIFTQDTLEHCSLRLRSTRTFIVLAVFWLISSDYLFTDRVDSSSSCILRH